jgi:hypothetical protein
MYPPTSHTSASSFHLLLSLLHRLYIVQNKSNLLYGVGGDGSVGLKMTKKMKVNGPRTVQLLQRELDRSLATG